MVEQTIVLTGLTETVDVVGPEVVSAIVSKDLLPWQNGFDDAEGDGMIAAAVLHLHVRIAVVIDEAGRTEKDILPSLTVAEDGEEIGRVMFGVKGREVAGEVVDEHVDLERLAGDDAELFAHRRRPVERGDIDLDL